MVLTVKAHEIDLTVYGIRQVDYVRDGVSGYQQFDQVVADSAFLQAAAIDEQTAMVAKALKLRRLKSEDLGKALALLDGILCSYDAGNPKSSDLSKYVLPNDQVDAAKALLDRMSKYGLTVEYDVKTDIGTGCKSHKVDGSMFVQIKRGTAMHAQAEIEQMIDAENNNIQQEMSTLQGFVQKRDSAFNNASKVVQKFNGTADSNLRALA